MASFVEGDYSRAVPVVSSFYRIVDMQKHQTEDAVRFLIAESDIYDSFPKLVRELAKMDMIATAKRTRYASRLMPTLSSTNLTVEDGIVVTVSKVQKQPPRQGSNRYLPSIPAILFIATLTVVFIDGLYRSQSDFANVFIRNPLLLAAVYTMSLVGILGVHEMGHMIAAKHHGIRASWPYFIPGIPGLFVPTFGAMIQIRSNMTNRNVLFDVGIAGPIAGLLVTMVVSVYGSSISVLVPADRVQDLFGDSGLLRINSSILMQATLDLTGHGAAAGDAALIMSPVLFAAWVGFLITFLNLLPAWQLDGGHLARSALGVRWHRILTYSSVGVLTGLGYFIMAAFVLLFSSRAPESTPLDDVSPLSKKRKALFWVAIALAVLCAPLPAEVFTSLA
ncbi:site-2 protease family protein [Nitrososphaera viennensis]|uniref:Site-2 protease family protein n=2 Tax=Nitrososphaera viennensis TaxID=1034015 RepID=A0A977IC09_9ARCH|nr:site-2 protease family protein [Nitrososphaera viennensis]AIC16018.1 putative peptidase M50 [Nitrososphaera viennensis EN76]UVS67992.1 site-2 protease family protein [Nitrososphaera viennensis]